MTPLQKILAAYRATAKIERKIRGFTGVFSTTRSMLWTPWRVDDSI